MPELLGRLIDIEPQISDGSGTVKPVNLKDAAGVQFTCFVPGSGGDTFIVKYSAVKGSGFAAFNPITRYYTKALLDGTSQWVDSGDLASNLGTVTIGSGCIAFYVDAADLPSEDAYIEVVPGTSGIVIAVLGDLLVQRDPKYLRALNS